MPKERFSNQISKPEQPFVLSEGEISKKFRVLTSEELEKLGLSKKPKSTERKTGKEVTIEQAMEILGEDVLGPEAIEITFGFKPEEIPPIPFTIEDLERAKELGQFLELRVDQTSEGKPLNMGNMFDMLQPEFTAQNQGRILNSYGKSDSWYKNEDFLKDVPQVQWVLISKDIIPNSLSKNYLQQTEVIADYIKNEVFKDKDLPDVYQEALDEFESKKAGIQSILSSNWQEAAKQLSELKINQLVRQLPVENMYDLVMYFKNNKKRLLEGKYTWTYRRASSGGLVDVGRFASAGAGVGGWAPGRVDGDLGVSFSRSH